MATINTTDPKPGFVYDLDTDTWYPLAGIAAQSLDGLTDVIITSPATNQSLIYDGTNWVNSTEVGDITAVTSGTGITVTNGTGPIPTITNSMATEITAKGDLIVGTGSATFDNLAAGSNGETLVADSSTTTGLSYQANWAAGKNKIINGAMQIDQRNNGATSTASGVYTLDRWEFNASQATKFTWGQNYGGVTPPVGFSKYLGFKTTTAVTSGAGDYFFFGQKIEGQNLADLAWGTASAKTITLSFYVYSSLTGTFGGAIENSAGNRAYPFSYSISAANTWERKTITLAGDTTGTWLTTNGIGLKLWIGLGVGSSFSGTAGAWAAADNFSSTGAVSVVGTLNATYYITGVQIEQASTATAFQTATGTIQGELDACRRYLPAITSVSGDANEYIGYAYGTNATVYSIPFDVPARVKPTGITVNNAGSINAFAFNTPTSVIPTFNTAGIFSGSVIAAPSITAGDGSRLQIQNTSSILFTGCEL